MDKPRGWFKVSDKKLGVIAWFKFKSHAIEYARKYHKKVKEGDEIVSTDSGRVLEGGGSDRRGP